MTMLTHFSWTYPKEAGPSHVNEDELAFSEDFSVFALSDGATVSFDSSKWAKILVKRYIRLPELDRGWLQAAIDEFHSDIDRRSMSWSEQAGYDQGSFATLLGLRWDTAGREIHLLAVGDCLAVLLNGGRVEKTFPFTSPQQFTHHPLMLGTRRSDNDRIFDLPKGIRRCRWMLQDLDNPVVLCMTDALGKWFLTSPAENLRQLHAVQNEIEFGQMIEAERANKKLKYDDTTLLAVTQLAPQFSKQPLLQRLRQLLTTARLG